MLYDPVSPPLDLVLVINLWLRFCSCSMVQDAASLSVGMHEFDVLGFEDCCDGHAELEVHLPCDDVDSSWRLVVKGQTDCLVCGSSSLAAECSVDTESAGCCGASGGHVLCHPRLEDGTCDEQEDASTSELISAVILD